MNGRSDLSHPCPVMLNRISLGVPPGSQMRTTVSLATIAQHPTWSDDTDIELTEDEASASIVWSAELFMAEREAAVAIHYRPFRPECLVFVVQGVEYEVEPPPDCLSDHLRMVAKKWASGSGTRGTLRRWFCRLLGRSVVGVLAIEGLHCRREWIVNCWSARKE